MNNTLNKQQQEVVDSSKSLVNIAGPGSGKTKTLTAKINKLVLTDKINMYNILVLTFTNASSKDISDRIFTSLGIKPSRVYFGTFHSIFIRLIKDNKLFVSAGFKNTPTFIDTSDVQRKIFTLMNHEFNYGKNTQADMNYIAERAIHDYYNATEKKIPKNKKLLKIIFMKHIIDISSLMNLFSTQIYNLEANGIDINVTIEEVYIGLVNKVCGDLNQNFEKYQKTIFKSSVNAFLDKKGHNGDKSIIISLIKDVLIKYIGIKLKEELITFDDMLLCTLYFLKTNNKFKIKMQKQFKFIFVDEFQDTNVIQNSILSLLHNPATIITVIGDPYQSIYEFLGAKISNILTATHTYNADSMQLITNYRSTENIVNLTNFLGTQMVEKVDNWLPCKSINKKDNLEIALCRNTTDTLYNKRASTYIIDLIENIQRDEPDSTCAIISRKSDNFSLEMFLKRRNIGFNKLGGLKINNTKEIVQLIHLITYAFDTSKMSSLIEILASIEGLGEKTIKTYELSIINNNAKKVNTKITKFIADIDELVLGATNINDLVIKIEKFYMLNIFTKIEKSFTTNSRIKEAKERITFFFKEIGLLDKPGILDYIIDDILDTTIKNMDEKVTISTIHSAKGLEWDYVFFILDEYAFTTNNFAENQRLVYVGVSRAKKHLSLLSPTSSFYTIDEEYIKANPSMFISFDGGSLCA